LRRQSADKTIRLLKRFYTRKQTNKLTVDQSKRLMSTDESVLVSESVGNSSHSSVGIGAFLVIERGHGDGRHSYFSEKLGD